MWGNDFKLPSQLAAPQLTYPGVLGALGHHVLQRAIGERERGGDRAHRLSKEDNLVKERQLRLRTAELRIAQVRLIFQSMGP